MDYKIVPQDLLQLIKGRRSIRKWLDRRVEDWKIRQILEAGVYAPSGSNDQRQRFMAIADYKRIEEFCRVKGNWCTENNPSLIIMSLFDLGAKGNHNNNKLGKTWGHLMWQDTAASMQNMTLMAEALGLSSCWVSLVLFRRLKAIRGLLGLDKRYRIAGSLFVGYRVATPDIKIAKWLGKPIKRNMARYII